ncbi:hypothetical protein F5144DRAFT_55014 [Chaetomium tenue]|uniref:Uncharacterized protein n=1 Tax=Chaetomium tenue TaxID=1854479 RepID=A0ACB7PN45_9PEZI|nr:hypothetical protein F5144DRAFT_55014 [Chaetomium globosum]
MPSVNVAMERSLRRGFLDLFVASLRPALARRDLEGQITDVKTAFSSWDNCMQVNYCKWPAIALIIVGGLIIFAVAWCMIRCLCCGLSCCCSCFQCLKCCGNCCGCCDPPRGSRHKYLDEPYIPPNHGYKAQEPMHAGFDSRSTAAPVSKGSAFPQFAEFDAGGKKDDDSLPQMPEWESAERKKVYLEEEAVEMNALKKPEAGGQAAGAALAGGAAGAISPHGSRSPVNRSPYGPPGGNNGFFAASAINNNDPYSQGAPAYNQPGMAYNEPNSGYGMAGAAMGPGRRSPQAFNNGYNDGHNNGYGRTHDYPDPGAQGSYDNYGGAPHQQPYDNYDSQSNQGYGIARHQTPHAMDPSPYGADQRRSPAPQGPYGADSRRSPAPRGPYGAGGARHSPVPQGAGAYDTPYLGGGGGPDPRRSPTPQQQAGFETNSNPYGGARAPPQRQYSNNSGMHSPAVSSPTPLRNDAGFDFTSGYSRPQGPIATTTSPVNAGGYRQPSPSPPAELGGGAGGYPGYKPYQP